MKSLVPITMSFLLLSCAWQSHAQLDSCNAFIQGNYVEIGVNWNGAYGSSSNAPAGYHPRGASPIVNSAACDSILHGTSNNELGFVADPDKDGWAVGSPAYYGDYYLPGYPQEGWSILSGGSQANVWNGPSNMHPSSVCDTRITGSNTMYYIAGGTKIAVWEGIYDSIQITQTTELDTTKTYFITHVKFKNTSHQPRTNVYYMRTLDPDNDITLSGDYTTKNKIESQYPGAAPFISTWGVHFTGAYLGLGTLDTPAKAFILKAGLMTSHRIDSIYNGYDSTVIYSDSNTIDAGIGLVFNVGTLNPVDSSIVAFAYMFKRTETDSALVATKHPFPAGPGDTTSHTGVNNTTTGNNNISIYPNPLKDGMSVSGLKNGDMITIYDMMGKKVDNWFVPADGSNTFNTTGLPAGMYILRVTDKSGNIKAKLPIQKL